MLIFTFLVTIRSEGFESIDEAEQTVHEYFFYKNEKDIYSLSQLFTDSNEINNLDSKLTYINKISLLYIKEETNESILNAYLKHNNSIKKENFKVYKVDYEVSYNDKSSTKYKDGIYESWFFLTRENLHSKWLIDVYDI